jgi:hypothetical protein
VTQQLAEREVLQEKLRQQEQQINQDDHQACRCVSPKSSDA